MNRPKAERGHPGVCPSRRIPGISPYLAGLSGTILYGKAQPFVSSVGAHTVRLRGTHSLFAAQAGSVLSRSSQTMYSSTL